jgi:6,7-dimethyl-8-ribityllumazine synthase
MMKVLEGQLHVQNKKFLIIVSRTNEFITTRLVDGAKDALLRHGAKEEEITLAWVPGAFEIPYLAKKASENKTFDAIICLGAIIRGDTPHFNYIAAESAKGIAQIALDSGRPIIYGVLTTDNIEQAIERAGSKSGNKGASAAMAAIEMLNLYSALENK